MTCLSHFLTVGNDQFLPHYTFLPQEPAMTFPFLTQDITGNYQLAELSVFSKYPTTPEALCLRQAVCLKDQQAGYVKF